MKLNRIGLGLIIALIIGVLPLESYAQDNDFWQGSTFRSEVPSPSSFLGYKLGDDLTPHHRMVDYIHALQEAAPDRVKLIQTGESQEGRPIYLVIISSPENMQHLEQHRQAVARLRDPRNTSPEQAREIAAEEPVITWLNYANDGEESASFEAGMRVAYHFAAGTDAKTTAMLDKSIIVIQPAHNPDSHQRHVVWMKGMKVGDRGTPDRNAAEHQADWLMSTSDTHYHIDSNRDAFALSQKESRIVSQNLLHWNPQVWVDHHGEPEEYYFPPYAIPVNPNYPASTAKWADVFGKHNGEAFDRHGWTYRAGEVFDLHYAGYWDSYPAFNGAIGMTYETNGGGDKGFVYRKADGTLTSLRNGLSHHVVASIATVQTASENRQQLLQSYYEFFHQGLEEVKYEDIKQVALPASDHPNDTEDLVKLLREHQIEVYRTDREISTRGIAYLSGEEESVTLPKGSYIVPMAQPQKRLAKVLLERNVDIQPEFLEQARAAHRYNESVGENAPKESLGFYDVTAWSLPLTYGVPAYGLTDAAENLTKLSADPQKTGGVSPDRKANYAYIFPYNTNDAAHLMSRLITEGYKVTIATKGFTQDGKQHGRGEVVVRVQRNPESLHERIRSLAQESGVMVEPVDGAWTQKGITLGSQDVVNIRKPRIAVLMDEPSRARSYGALWYTLEKRYEVPFTALRVADFNRVNLYSYDVVIMPPGSVSGYKRMLGESGIAKLKAWIENGGIFVGIKDGAAFAADADVNLTSARLLDEVSDSITVSPTPGSIVQVDLDNHHFLSLGYGDQIAVQVNSSYIFTPSEKGANVGTFDGRPHVSGFVFADNEGNYPGNAYLIHEPRGRGKVILFAEQPVFRLYWRGLERLFINSVLLAPSF